MNGTRNCTDLSESEIKAIAVVRVGVAAICAVVLAGLSMLFFCKQCHRGKPKAVERVTIYVTIGAFLSFLGYIFNGFQRIFSGHVYDDTSKSCETAAYLAQSLEGAQIVIYFIVVVEVLLIACFGEKINHNSTAACSDRAPWCTFNVLVVCIELVAVTFAVILSFGLSSYPFTTQTYGQSGPWCWITYKNPRDNCDENDTGFTEQIFLWYIWFLGLSVFSVIFAVVTLVYTCCKDSCGCNRRNCSTVALLVYLCFAFCMTIVEMVARFTDHSSSHRSFDLWMAYAVLTPLSKIPLPIIVALTYADCFNICRDQGYEPINDR